MRSALALVRVAWLSATSYRLATLMSFGGVIVSILPLFFVAGALQPVAAGTIAAEGGQYFAFMVVGVASIYVISTAAGAAAGAIAGNIGSGTFEALLVTRTSLPAILVGLSGYGILMSLIRAFVLMAGAALLGARYSLLMIPAVAVIVLLTILAYAGIGLVSAALVLVFRTSGPLISLVITGSALLGGAYYSTTVVPGWLQALTEFVPLAYALRAVRMLLLGGAGLGEVAYDVSLLALIAAGTMTLGGVCLVAALRRARMQGTLSQY